MKTQRTIRRTVLAMALAAFATGASAFDVPEMEPNESWAPQPLGTLEPQGNISVVNAMIDPNAFDSDFYTFVTTEGAIAKFDVVGDGFLVSKLTLFNEAMTEVLAMDDGDSASPNAFIEQVVLPAGTYVLAVNSPLGPSEFGGSGSYKVTILDLTQPPAPPVPTPTPTALNIKIDIKPGQKHRARINPKSKDTIAVALLSSKELKFSPVLDVNQATVTFGATGSEDSLRRCVKGGHDFNRDGIPDLVCHFQKNEGAFERGDLTGTVKGKTKDNVAFEGTGDLKVVAEKRNKRHRDHDRDRHRHSHNRR